MSRSSIAFILGVTLFATVALSQQPRPQQSSSILSLLKEGQPVSVKDAGFNYELTMYVDGPDKLTHKIIEVTDSYVVVRDLPGITDTAINVHFIKSVAIVRLRAE